MKRATLIIIIVCLIYEIHGQAPAPKTDSELLKQLTEQLTELNKQISEQGKKIDKLLEPAKKKEETKETAKEEIGYFSLKKIIRVKIYDGSKNSIENEKIKNYKRANKLKLTDYERYKHLFIDSVFISIKSKKITAVTLFYEDNIQTVTLNNDFIDLSRDLYIDISGTEKIRLNDLVSYYGIADDDHNEILIKLSPRKKRVVITKK